MLQKTDSQIYKSIISQNGCHIFVICLKWSGIFKSINDGSPGRKNAEFMEMLGFGPSHNKVEVYKTQIDQNNSPELLNLLFTHMFHKNNPTNCKTSHNSFFHLEGWCGFSKYDSRKIQRFHVREI